MKVLSVDHDFPLNRLEVTFFTFDEIIALSQMGVEMYVISRNAVESASIHGIVAWGIMRDYSLSTKILREIKRQFASIFFSKRENLIAPGFGDATRGPLDMDLVKRYRRIIESKVAAHSIDLVHAQWPYPQGLAATIACKSLQKPLVVTTRGGDVNVEPSIGHGHRLDSRKDQAIRDVLAFASKVIVGSHFMAEKTLEAGCDRTKIEYIPGGVDLGMYRPGMNSLLLREAYSIGDRPVVLTLINNLTRPVKGLDYLLKAIPLVKKEFDNILFLIGGSHVTHTMLETARSLSIEDNLLFVGEVPRIQTPIYFAGADLVVVPSLAEAEGLVAIEAMASALPIVASNVGGLPESVQDGINGFLVPPKDVSALAKRIVDLLSLPEQRRRMGKEGRRIATEKFDIKDQISKIYSLYKELADSRTKDLMEG